MGLNLEQYRDVLDAACPEKDPKPDCFDALYDIIHKHVEKVCFPYYLMHNTPYLEYSPAVLCLSAVCSLQGEICRNTLGLVRSPIVSRTPHLHLETYSLLHCCCAVSCLFFLICSFVLPDGCDVFYDD